MKNQDEQNPNYYAIIPATVRYDKSLKPNAKLLYGEITALCSKKGYCWAKNSYFAELYDVSKETISRWISQLADNGYIKIELKYSDGTKEIKDRYLHINDTPPIDKKINRYCQKDQYPIDKKIKHNSTSISNTFDSVSKDTHRQTKVCMDSPIGECSEPKGSPIMKKEIFHKEEKEERPIKNYITGQTQRTQKTQRTKKLNYIKFLPKYKHLIELWNGFKDEGCWTSTHKISEDSSTINAIIKYLKQLQDGTFGTRCDVDKEWMKKCKVNHSLLHKKWTEKEIISVLTNYKKCFKDGYMNGNKEKYLPKSMKDFLYKEFGSTSWFLKIASCPPKSNSEIITAKPKDKDIYDKYRAMFNGAIKTPQQEQNLILKVNDIIDEVAKIQASPGKYYSHTGFSSYFSTYVFHTTYIDWLKKRKKVIPEFIGVGGMMWKYFVDFASEYHHYYLYPTEIQLKDIIWDSERFAKDRKFDREMEKREKFSYADL